jgi:hypothetical protein
MTERPKRDTVESGPTTTMGEVRASGPVGMVGDERLRRGVVAAEQGEETTQMTSIPDVSAAVEAAAKRVAELSELVAARAKENGLVWLEGYEKVLQNMLDLEEEAAKRTGVDWASTLATVHANFVRETSEVFLQTLSKQLKS